MRHGQKPEPKIQEQVQSAQPTVGGMMSSIQSKDSAANIALIISATALAAVMALSSN
jgi:hypothetical protein